MNKSKKVVKLQKESNMEEVLEIEKPLTIKDLKVGLFKWIFSAWGIAIISGILSGYAFFYNTNTNIDELKENKIEVNKQLVDIHKDIEQIKLNQNTVAINNQNNKEEIIDMKKKIDRIENKQDEILNLLIEMKNKK